MRLRTALGTALVLFVSPVAHGGHGEASARAAAQATIQATVVPTRVVARRAPRGRVGDVEYLVWSVRDRYGRTIGMAVFGCRWIEESDRLCVGDIELPLGSISVQGSSATRELGVFSVVGGTGRYVGASGELAFRAIGSRKLVISMTV